MSGIACKYCNGRAYLSTVTPAEIAGVVEKALDLRDKIMRGKRCVTDTGPAVKPVIELASVHILDDLAALIERLAASQAETRRRALEEVEAQAEQIMLDVANEWHRQIGIDDVLKSKLVKRIADTVATGVFSRAIRALEAQEQGR